SPESVSLAPEGASSPLPAVQAAPELAPVSKYARDDTTPIPRPSTYYGREHYHDIREENAQLVRQAAREAARRDSSPEPRHAAPATAQIGPVASQTGFEDPTSFLLPEKPAGRIDKSVLQLGEPKR